MNVKQFWNKHPFKMICGTYDLPMQTGDFFEIEDNLQRFKIESILDCKFLIATKVRKTYQNSYGDEKTEIAKLCKDDYKIVVGANSTENKFLHHFGKTLPTSSSFYFLTNYSFIYEELTNEQKILLVKKYNELKQMFPVRFLSDDVKREYFQKEKYLFDQFLKD